MVINVPGLERLWAALPEARIVGGAVRDTLLGRPVADVDFASPLSPQEVMARLGGAGIKTVPTGLEHGTVTAVAEGRGFEITTLRRDIETDGRHAVVAFTDDWETDAARRDFTINAMSMARDGMVFDYFGGKKDLAAGRVRFVGDAGTRIAEDYLRIMRFFRFFARYGKGEPDPEAVTAISQLRDGLSRLSVERVWSELKRILSADDPRPAVALMAKTGVLALTIPEGTDVPAMHALVARDAPVEALLRFAVLLRGDVEQFAVRLKISNSELETLRSLRQSNRLVPAADDADLRRALADEDAETLVRRTWLAQDEQPGWENLRARIAVTPRPVFPLQGRDITAMGIAPGPRVGELLAELRSWWWNNGCVADFETCRTKAKTLISA